ncbi:Cytochrome P450 monooxygenase lepH [Lachnellula suecica]|uniref:Cytochrome P450 monooxygenase lepH n=1 Tax=Lachnellula suecica TaxID=602035 RepID=A0A8T9CB74_9HELO|nr:Cytochrome P450 monooxygenase lepH [Lachnellula suecica]
MKFSYLPSSWLIFTLYSLVAFVLYRRLSAWLHYRSVVRKNGCQAIPNYPHKDPVFGLDLFLSYKKAFEERRFLDLTQRLFQKYGKTFETNGMGVRVIKTMDPEITKYVHATYFDHFGVEKLRSGVEHLWGDGITVVEGDKWATRRKLIKPSFDVVHIANLENRGLGRHVGRLMDLIPQDASAVDLMPLFKRLSLDTASEFIFGKSMDALRSPDSHKEFLDAYFYAQRGTAVRLMLGPKLRFLHRDPRWWKDCDTVNSFIDKHVDDALTRRAQDKPAGLEGRKDQFHLVDEMAKATQDRLTLRFQMQNVFTPAHDGAAVTLSNALFHLSRNPKVWSKLRAEILPTKDSTMTYDLLKTYQYLKNTIRETHRVTPLSTLISRECMDEVVFPSGGGKDGTAPLYIRKGDIVEMNFRCTLRDKTYWGDDADEFRPERWDDLRPMWEYTPFGGGPRICLGFRLVFAEVAYTMATILREFERIESRDDRPWTEETRATFSNLNGCKVALFPAKSAV